MDSLRFNDDRAVQMLGQFAGNRENPNYLFDTTGLIIWISKSAGLFDDDLVTRINGHRYQMDHANTKLSAYYVYSRLTGGKMDLAEIEAGGREGILLSLSLIHGGTHRLLKEIEQEATIPDAS